MIWSWYAIVVVSLYCYCFLCKRSNDLHTVYNPSGGHRGRPIGPGVRKYYWEYDDEGWHNTLFTGYPSGWFGLKYGFSRLGQKYIMNLWKAFISQLKLKQLSWNNNLPWSDREDFSESLSEYIEFITEMQLLLSNSSCKNDWLNYLRERRIGLAVTENGWDVSDDDHDADNTEWVKWLLLFPFADSGKITSLEVSSSRCSMGQGCFVHVWFFERRLSELKRTYMQIFLFKKIFQV